MSTSNSEVVNRIHYYQVTLNPLSANGAMRIHRHWEFINSSKYNRMAQGGASATLIATSAITGGIAGAKVGGIIGDTLAKSSGAKVGAGVGFTVGFTLGVGGGLYAYVNITEQSQGYKDWIEVKKENAIDSAIAMKYAEDKILKDYTCPYTCFVTLIPSRSPSGHLFETNAVLSAPRDEKGRITCPITREKFTPDMLVADLELGLFIHKRIYELTCIDIEYASNNPQLKELLEKHNANIKHVVEACYNTIFALIDKRRADAITTFEQSQRERLDFVKIFGETATSKLDWSLDWKTILQTRWTHFYPEIPVVG